MNRILVLLAALIMVFGISSCASMQSKSNIVVQSEFIYCEDSSCEICSGTGQLVCTGCEGSKTGACEDCGGTGVVDCKPVLLIDCIDGNIYSPSDDEFSACSICMGTGTLGSDGDTEACYECGGDGLHNCPYCEGAGVVDCKSCNDGITDCSVCNGAGYLVHGTTVYHTVCLNCETVLEEGATVCTGCGMNALVYSCKECGTISNEELESCPSCGK